ncbi:ABC transporter ATP-binding protein, partial [Exiguobacterium sp.]|uniref:ABC transporter ATP-binding protein n=1 Tax=Exiguobacterium sp. TaxID=44751 RepID=UPI0028AC23A2
MDLRLNGVSKSFHQQNVLQQIDLLIPSGEICGLLGPSGSGKTTLIRLMIGAIQADAGSIQIGDTSMPSFKMLSQIGFMPQNDALYEDLSGLANLQFFGSLYNMSRQDLAKRIEEVLTLVDLTNDQKKLVRHYSGGMKKRLSLAISILHRPSILFL